MYDILHKPKTAIKAQAPRDLVAEWTETQSPRLDGSLQLQGIELSMYDILHKPRTAIKAQAPRDLVAEWTETQSPRLDGSLQLQGISVGILVTSSKG
jgi:hypothetical protein